MRRLASTLVVLLVAGCAAPPLEDAPDRGTYAATITTDGETFELEQVAVVLPADLLQERREVKQLRVERKQEYWSRVARLAEVRRIVVGARTGGKLQVVVELRSGEALRGTVGGNLELCGARRQDGLRTAVRLDRSRSVEVRPTP